MLPKKKGMVIEMEENKQVVEVEYDKNLVEEYKKNYIMEEEGIGAIEGEVYDTQVTLNETPFNEMIEDGEVIVDDKNE